MTYIVVGLGNPEKKYEHTRHNVGFDVLQVLSQKLDIPLNKLRCKALTGEGRIGGERVVLAAPQTYMNLSGQSVVELLRWYKADAKHLIVVYDDVDLPQGRLRVRAGGSAGTHNGMRNIVYLTGRDDFPRVRIGIGKPEPGRDLAAYVLGKYPPEARQAMFDAFLRAADAVQAIVTDGAEAAMARFNGEGGKGA
ncbi:MAG TPA: aminoacyl-tRNA hydrolase [Candidatus Spyradocola merdavium]|nr:aminoacyl-tRNA hydrolase [Candidatus Spyradocola merdavium]